MHFLLRFGSTIPSATCFPLAEHLNRWHRFYQFIFDSAVYLSS